MPRITVTKFYHETCFPYLQISSTRSSMNSFIYFSVKLLTKTHLQALLRCTPEEIPDHNDLKEALVKFNQLVADIVAHQRKGEQLNKLLHLQKVIKGYDVGF
jgi:hypothetical protein